LYLFVSPVVLMAANALIYNKKKQIMTFSGWIIVPSFVLAVLAFFLLQAYAPPEMLWLMVIPLGFGIGGFVVRRGLDEWWYARYPPRLDDIEINILKNNFAYYRDLPPASQIEFERRLAIFRLQKDFQMRGKKKIPGDIQLLVSACAVQLTMGFPYRKEFYQRLGMVVLYLRTFITPELNGQLHAIELNQDLYNCLLISIETFVKGLQAPKSYYNIGLYGMAKAWRIEHGITEEDMPIEDRNGLLLQLHLMRGFELGYIFKYTALADMEIFEMCTEHFFLFPEQMQAEMPAMYNYLMGVYKQDPINRQMPIIQEFAANQKAP
jgi:hypothetical protein